MAEPQANHRAFIALGSNIQPEVHIMQALEYMRESLRLTGLSPFFRTPALERPEQPPYLNGVVRVETVLAPRTLKYDVLRPIEARLGRVRTEDRYAPRTIDLDLLVHGATVRDESGLRLPDPELIDRPFNAVAVLHLDPGFILPGAGQPLSELVPAGATAGTADTAFRERLRTHFNL